MQHSKAVPKLYLCHACRRQADNVLAISMHRLFSKSILRNSQVKTFKKKPHQLKIACKKCKKRYEMTYWHSPQIAHLGHTSLSCLGHSCQVDLRVFVGALGRDGGGPLTAEPGVKHVWQKTPRRRCNGRGNLYRKLCSLCGWWRSASALLP